MIGWIIAGAAALLYAKSKSAAAPTSVSEIIGGGVHAVGPEPYIPSVADGTALVTETPAPWVSAEQYAASIGQGTSASSSPIIINPTEAPATQQSTAGAGVVYTVPGGGGGVGGTGEGSSAPAGGGTGGGLPLAQ